MYHLDNPYTAIQAHFTDMYMGKDLQVDLLKI